MNISFDETYPTHSPKACAKFITKSYKIDETQVGMRLDKLASEVFDDLSRASLQKYIQNGDLLVNGEQVKPKYALKLGDWLTLSAIQQDHSQAIAQDIAIEVLYEDDSVLVINKPAGMVVHPAVGNWQGTLVNALLYHYPDVSHLPRAGIVHRIDKDTSGLLMVAKTAKAQLNLIDQLKNKSVYRHYQCIVSGTPSALSAHRVIDAPIGRHPTARTKMAIRANGKIALTQIDNISPLAGEFCLLDVSLQTGRTHQIRVHLSSKGHPLVGDKVYGRPIKKTLPNELHEQVLNFPRQALHAYTLGFLHPVTGRAIQVTSPLPQDMQDLLDGLRFDTVKLGAFVV